LGIITYLQNIKFSNALKVTIPKNDLIFRDNYLINLSKNKKIIHIGCVDHLDLIEKKIQKDQWFHKKLLDNSNKCIGIDINKKGIEFLIKKYNISNLYNVDVIKDKIPFEIQKETFDYIFLPDVLEHIGNPVFFLKKLKEKFSNVNKFIITVPNAFRIDNFIFSLKNKEFINSDHRFWFTYYTLSKILVDAGFEITDIKYSEHSKSNISVIKKFLIKRYNILRDTIVIEAK
jgi:hypothetical protein